MADAGLIHGNGVAFTHPPVRFACQESRRRRARALLLPEGLGDLEDEQPFGFRCRAVLFEQILEELGEGVAVLLGEDEAGGGEAVGFGVARGGGLARVGAGTGGGVRASVWG